MQLFYTKEINNTDDFFVFDKEESKHIIKVLRKNEKDTLYITDGIGHLYQSEIELASEKKCKVKINKVTFFENTPYYNHIVIAPTKNNDRIEWFVEKATEIGIHEISFVICENSERKFFKTDRIEKIVQAAMKQSNQFYKPIINEPVSFNDFIKNNKNQINFIAHCEDDLKTELFNSIEANCNSVILIGPEGDFSKKEIKLALENNYKPIALGKTRLRTETAALVACQTIVLKNT